MKTGIIITAEETNKGLNDISVKRVHIKGEDWVNNDDNSLTLKESDDWINLMVEGIVTVISYNHDNRTKDSAVYFREVIHKLEQSFIQPSNTNFNGDSKEVIFTANS